jgi:DNA-directed RNA polymerase specialized sigma24 family protein
MSSIGSLTLCIQNLRSPDGRARDEAAQIIWERFSARLQDLARRHLDNRIRRREDEQDILQSMYASFCAGQLEGKPSPASREELWRLLVRITLCKVVNTVHRNHAARRDVRRERAGREGAGLSTPQFPGGMLDQVDRAATDPGEKLIMVEEFDRLLHNLPEELRQIVVWKVEGYTNAKIALMMGRTVRCVELKLQLIRKLLGQDSLDGNRSDLGQDDN